MRILGYDYTIVQDGTADEIGASGRCHWLLCHIQVASDLSPQQVQSTILHEALEGLDHHLSLDLPHATIMALEAGLYQVLTAAGVDLGPLLDKKRNWGGQP